ncbi:MAG: hypothetical protein HY553_12605 [Elusimicrobia bacterium]|nr:hypothetical protein [Elusimicrobiota bacterium]
MPVGLAALLLAPAVFAQVAVPPGALQSIAESQGRVQRTLEPVKADPEAFSTLIDTIQRDGEPGGTEADPTVSLEGPAFGGAPAESVGAVLHGGQLDQPELGEEGSGYSDLLLRFGYTHLEGIQSFSKELDDGAAEIDSWHFVLGMDGSVQSALRTVLVFVPTQDGSDVEMDEKRSRITRFDPRDPRVAERWKDVEKKLGRLRRAYQT